MASDNSQHSVLVLSTASGFWVLPGCFQPSEAGSTPPARVRHHEGSSLLADDPSASDRPSSAPCSRALNSTPPARVRLHGGSSLLADDPSASDRTPWSQAAPPRPLLTLGLGLLPRHRTAPLSAHPRTAPPRPRTALPRPRTALPRPWTAPLGLGFPSASDSPPRPWLRTASAASMGQLQHAAFQSVHVLGSGGHSPLPYSHSKCSRAWKWGPLSSRLHAATFLAAQPLSPFLSLSLLCPRTGVEYSDGPSHRSPRSPCSRPWLPPVLALGAGI